MNTACLLLLLLLAITFIQSGYDKIVDWKGNVSWLKSHFAQTPIKNQVPLALGIILVLEIIAGILTLSGVVQILTGNESIYGYYGAVVSCVALLFLLLGQRLAKDYDGARTIVIYFIPAVLAVYWLN